MRECGWMKSMNECLSVCHLKLVLGIILIILSDFRKTMHRACRGCQSIDHAHQPTTNPQGRLASAPLVMPEPRHTYPQLSTSRGTGSTRRTSPPPPADLPRTETGQWSRRRRTPERQPLLPPFRLETCREHYDKVVTARHRVDVVLHEGSKWIRTGGHYPIKMSGCRFGNLTPHPHPL